MPEESVEGSKSPEQPNKKRLKLLFEIALTLVILMIMLVLSALGFLLYGLIAGKLAVSIIGVMACVISFGLLFGIFRLINKILLRRADELAGSLNEARAVGARVKEELSTRYGRAKIHED